MRKDPQKRFTTEEALAHPWIVELVEVDEKRHQSKELSRSSR